MLLNEAGGMGGTIKKISMFCNLIVHAEFSSAVRDEI